MLQIDADQMARLDEIHFYGKLGRFTAERCRNPKLARWLTAQKPGHAVWHRAWPRVRALGERDCALVLIFLAVCECEDIAAGPVESLIAHLAQHEIGIKLFLSERGYFQFSDFEFTPTAQSEPGTEE